MSRPERQALKRKVAQARNDLNRALAKVVALHEEFEPVHPQHAELLEAIGKGLLFQRELLEQFWVICWGSPPNDWNSYCG